MASGLVFTSFRPAAIRAEAMPSSGGDRRRSPPQSGSANWWTPLFGWSPEPDYIDGSGAAGEKEKEKKKNEAAAAAEGRRVGRRFGAFTEEKAKELRLRMMESETFHDAMYHSAIAARLASDHPARRSGR